MNELTLLIANPGVALISSSAGLFLCPFQHWEPVIPFACVSCRTTCKCKCFIKCSWRITYLLWKNCYTRSWSVFWFSQLHILFHLMVHTNHETFHTLNHSESEIKFWSINWYNLGVILYPELVLHKQPSTFTITEILLRISSLQHVSAKS